MTRCTLKALTTCSTSLRPVASRCLLEADYSARDGTTQVAPLRIAAPDVPSIVPIVEASQTFSRLAGMPAVEWTLPQIQAADAVLISDMRTTRRNHIYIVPASTIGAIVDDLNVAQDLSRLTGYDKELDWQGFLPLYRDVLAVYNSHVVAIPFNGLMLMLYYRRDLFAAAGLEPPRTWEETIAAATRFNGTDLDGDGRANDYGICLWQALDCEYVSAPLMAVLASIVQSKGPSSGLHFNPETMQPAWSTAAWDAALGIVRNLSRLAPPPLQSVASDPLAQGNCFLISNFTRSRCAMALSMAGLFKRSSDARNTASRVRGQIGLAVIPGSPVVLDWASNKLVTCDFDRCPVAVQYPISSSQKRNKNLGPTGLAPASASGASGSEPNSTSSQVAYGNASSSEVYGGSYGRVYLVNKAPYASGGGLTMIMNKHRSDAEKAAAYSLMVYIIKATAGWGIITSAMGSSGPTRMEHLDPSNVDRWLQAGYHPEDLSSFLAAMRAALAIDNAAMDLRAVNTRLYGTLLRATALLLANHSVPLPAVATISRSLFDTALNTSMRAFMAPSYRASIRFVTASSASPPVSEPDGGAEGRGTGQAGASGQHSLAVALGVSLAGAVALAAALVWLVWHVGPRGRSRALGRIVAPGVGPQTTLCVTDIQDSTRLWETLPAEVMNTALHLHHACLRRCATAAGGYESATEGDSFILAFHNPSDALLFCLTAQEELLTLQWPDALLRAEGCQPVWLLQCPPGAAHQSPPSQLPRQQHRDGECAIELLPLSGTVERFLQPASRPFRQPHSTAGEIPRSAARTWGLWDPEAAPGTGSPAAGPFTNTPAGTATAIATDSGTQSEALSWSFLKMKWRSRVNRPLILPRSVFGPNCSSPVDLSRAGDSAGGDRGCSGSGAGGGVWSRGGRGRTDGDGSGPVMHFSLAYGTGDAESPARSEQAAEPSPRWGRLPWRPAAVRPQSVDRGFQFTGREQPPAGGAIWGPLSVTSRMGFGASRVAALATAPAKRTQLAADLELSDSRGRGSSFGGGSPATPAHTSIRLPDPGSGQEERGNVSSAVPRGLAPGASSPASDCLLEPRLPQAGTPLHLILAAVARPIAELQPQAEHSFAVLAAQAVEQDSTRPQLQNDAQEDAARLGTHAEGAVTGATEDVAMERWDRIAPGTAVDVPEGAWGEMVVAPAARTDPRIAVMGLGTDNRFSTSNVGGDALLATPDHGPCPQPFTVTNLWGGRKTPSLQGGKAPSARAAAATVSVEVEETETTDASMRLGGRLSVSGALPVLLPALRDVFWQVAASRPRSAGTVMLTAALPASGTKTAADSRPRSQRMCSSAAAVIASGDLVEVPELSPLVSPLVSPNRHAITGPGRPLAAAASSLFGHNRFHSPGGDSDKRSGCTVPQGQRNQIGHAEPERGAQHADHTTVGRLFKARFTFWGAGESRSQQHQHGCQQQEERNQENPSSTAVEGGPGGEDNCNRVVAEDPGKDGVTKDNSSATLPSRVAVSAGYPGTAGPALPTGLAAEAAEAEATAAAAVLRAGSGVWFSGHVTPADAPGSALEPFPARHWDSAVPADGPPCLRQDPRTQPALPAGARLVFAGLRVRMGISCGVSLQRDVSYSSVMQRTHYSGRPAAMAKAVAGAATGGMVLTSAEAHAFLVADADAGQSHVVLRRDPSHALVQIGRGRGGGNRGRTADGRTVGCSQRLVFWHAGLHRLDEHLKPLELYMAATPAQVARWALVGPPAAAATAKRQTLVPCALDAPVGHLAVASVTVAGASALAAANEDAWRQSAIMLWQEAAVLCANLHGFLATPQRALLRTGGAGAAHGPARGSERGRGPVQAGEGGWRTNKGNQQPLLTAVFTSASAAAEWGARLLEYGIRARWPVDLLAHELAEEIWREADGERVLVDVSRASGAVPQSETGASGGGSVASGQARRPRRGGAGLFGGGAAREAVGKPLRAASLTGALNKPRPLPLVDRLATPRRSEAQMPAPCPPASAEAAAAAAAGAVAAAFGADQDSVASGRSGSGPLAPLPATVYSTPDAVWSVTALQGDTRALQPSWASRPARSAPRSATEDCDMLGGRRRRISCRRNEELVRAALDPSGRPHMGLGLSGPVDLPSRAPPVQWQCGFGELHHGWRSRVVGYSQAQQQPHCTEEARDPFIVMGDSSLATSPGDNAQGWRHPKCSSSCARPSSSPGISDTDLAPLAAPPHCRPADGRAGPRPRRLPSLMVGQIVPERCSQCDADEGRAGGSRVGGSAGCGWARPHSGPRGSAGCVMARPHSGLERRAPFYASSLTPGNLVARQSSSRSRHGPSLLGPRAQQQGVSPFPSSGSAQDASYPACSRQTPTLIWPPPRPHTMVNPSVLPAELAHLFLEPGRSLPAVSAQRTDDPDPAVIMSFGAGLRGSANDTNDENDNDTSAATLNITLRMQCARATMSCGRGSRGRVEPAALVSEGYLPVPEAPDTLGSGAADQERALTATQPQPEASDAPQSASFIFAPQEGACLVVPGQPLEAILGLDLPQLDRDDLAVTDEQQRGNSGDERRGPEGPAVPAMANASMLAYAAVLPDGLAGAGFIAPVPHDAGSDSQGIPPRPLPGASLCTLLAGSPEVRTGAPPAAGIVCGPASDPTSLIPRSGREGEDRGQGTAAALPAPSSTNARTVPAAGTGGGVPMGGRAVEAVGIIGEASYRAQQPPHQQRCLQQQGRRHLRATVGCGGDSGIDAAIITNNAVGHRCAHSARLPTSLSAAMPGADAISGVRTQSLPQCAVGPFTAPHLSNACMMGRREGGSESASQSIVQASISEALDGRNRPGPHADLDRSLYARAPASESSGGMLGAKAPTAGPAAADESLCSWLDRKLSAEGMNRGPHQEDLLDAELLPLLLCRGLRLRCGVDVGQTSVQVNCVTGAVQYGGPAACGALALALAAPMSRVFVSTAAASMAAAEAHPATVAVTGPTPASPGGRAAAVASGVVAVWGQVPSGIRDQPFPQLAE